MFNLAAPYTATTGTACAGQIANAIGDCQIDTFSITSRSNAGSPVICGTNQGQHMILDSNGKDCQKVNIGLGNGAGSTAREWDIMVTQYKCGEEDGGPPGCLQWHTTSTGNVRSFNFPQLARGGAVTATVTHLSSQEYDICIRTPSGANHICYVPCTDPGDGTATAQQSFGLSISATIRGGEVDNTHCTQDWITISGGTTIANAQAGTNGNAGQSVLSERWCGRTFEVITGNTAIADVSVCTSQQPFRIGVHFDADEYPNTTDPTADDTTAANGECLQFPGGIIGFSLCYATGTPAATG